MKIYIKPTTKERPRFNASTGRAFTTNKTKGFEEALRWEYVKNNGKNFQDRFIEVDLIFAFIPPKSWSKKKTSEALEGRIRPTKSDIDNYIKSVLDSLNTVAYSDDRYVYKVSAIKKYDTEEYIEINIKEMNLAK